MSQPSKNSKLVLVLILGVFLAFFIVGRFIIDPSAMGRVNQGTLLIPHLDIDELGLRTIDGEPYLAEDMSGKWSLLYIADGSCEAACKNALYYLMRQLRLSLDRDVNRVRRIILHTSQPDDTLRGFLHDNVAGMLELIGDAQLINEKLAEIDDSPNDARGHIYIVSPDGFIFIWYPSHPDMESTLEESDRIRDDLKRTLKGSLIG